MKSQKRFLIFLLFLSVAANLLFGQSIEQAMTRKNPSCRDMFINAMQVLPALYNEKSFDSLHKALQIWENVCSDIVPVQTTRLLLEIEESNFQLSKDVDEFTIDILTEYADNFHRKENMNAISIEKNPDVVFFKFSSSWANDLLKKRKLDVNEKFICRVLNGEIKNPEKEISQNAQTYPEFKAYADKSFENKRKAARVNFTVGTGVWLPTKNLTTLGVHPTFLFQAGLKDLHNSLDFSLYIRYLNSANPYTVYRNNTEYTTDYYLGYYIGLDYTYYFKTTKRTDLGIMAGIGWDGFDYAENPYYYDYYYDPSHYTISSFNGNAGLRFNYYFTNNFYVGLLGRYNAINYYTHGGTNLSGDAISIDLIFGFNGKNAVR